jgi:hypothetical protein
MEPRTELASGPFLFKRGDRVDCQLLGDCYLTFQGGTITSAALGSKRTKDGAGFNGSAGGCHQIRGAP